MCVFEQAVSVVDPETAMTEARRSAEYHRSDRSPQGDFYRRDYSQISTYDATDQHGYADHGPHLQVPQANMAHPVDRNRSYPERHSNYPVQTSCYDGHTLYSGHGYDAGYNNIQPPEPTYPHPEMSTYQHAGAHLPVADRAHPGHARQKDSDENVVVPRQWTNV